MKADIESFCPPIKTGDMDDETAQKELDKIIESSSEVEKILEVLVDPDFVEEDRQRVRDLILGNSEESAGDVLAAIKRGDILDFAEKVLIQKSPHPDKVKRVQDLLAPADKKTLTIEPKVICDELGSELLKKYFKLLSGKFGGRPYFLPSPIQDEQIEDYLEFEMNRDNPEYLTEYVEGFIRHAKPGFQVDDGKFPIDMATNLTISFAKSDPFGQIEMMGRVGNYRLQVFYKYIRSKVTPRVRHIFEHFFGPDREKILKRYADHRRKNSHFTKSTLDKLHKFDKKKLGEL